MAKNIEEKSKKIDNQDNLISSEQQSLSSQQAEDAQSTVNSKEVAGTHSQDNLISSEQQSLSSQQAEGAQSTVNSKEVAGTHSQDNLISSGQKSLSNQQITESSYNLYSFSQDGYYLPIISLLVVIIILLLILLKKQMMKKGTLDNIRINNPIDGNIPTSIVTPIEQSEVNDASQTLSPISNQELVEHNQSTSKPNFPKVSEEKTVKSLEQSKVNDASQTLSPISNQELVEHNQSTSKPSFPKVSEEKTVKSTIKSAAQHHSKPKKISSNPKTDPLIFCPNQNTDWFILAHSAIGASHIKHNLPCQDRFRTEAIDETKWGIAVVCDGLGSKSHSGQGAEFVSRKVTEKFKKYILDQQWISKNILPSPTEWEKISLITLYETYQELRTFSRICEIALEQLGCTVIAVIYSPLGLLITHIGDGRAGYCDMQGMWYSMMTPQNGEYSNQVVAITSNIWDSKEKANQYVRSRIIPESVQAFCLMSDGSESFAYKTTQWDDKHHTCKTINKPADVFFNPVIKYARENQQIKFNNWKEKVTSAWEQLLIDGTPLIAQEPDDKTIILGILINNK